MLRHAFLACLFAAVAVVPAGCGGSDDDPQPLEIDGSWTDDWGYGHQIDETSWTTMDSVFHISQFDNDRHFLVAQNDAANEYYPELWSRFDWSWADGELYYCQSAFQAVSEDGALAAGADAADLETGCGGYPWTHLIPD